MKTKRVMIALTAALLPVSNGWASRIHSDTFEAQYSTDSALVYEKIGLFKRSVMFTDVFNIETRGTYEATLTDFRFPNPLKITGLNITTARESLGSLQGSGSFTFDAGPGDYYLGFFARAGNHNNHSARGKDKKFQSTANETGNEKSDNSRKVAHRNTRKRSVESEWIPNYRHPYDLKIERMNIGQYGIQVALLEQNSISTPLPGAVWLFISGLLGLTAMVRKRNRKTG